MICKFCGSEKIIRNGKPNKIQRFKYTKYLKSFIDEDKRVQYDDRPKQIAIILGTEGNGFRSISRILSEILGKKIYYQTVQKWLQKYYKNLKEALVNTDKNDIEILELDKLCTYFKQNPSKQFGLLLTATKTKLLHFASGYELK